MANYIVSSGEMSSGIILNSVDSMTILNGGIATVTKGRGRIYVSSGGTVNSTSINSSGSMTIFSGGIANYTSAYDWKSYIYVSFGGIVNSTNIRHGGTIHVSHGGVANNTIIDSAGDLYISKGGTANSATVNSDGYMLVSSGGTALEIRENGGYVEIADGANVTFTPNTIMNLVLSTFFSATVHSGTITSLTTVNSRGYMLVYPGGKANNTIVNSNGSMSVHSGGTANRITVNTCGSMRINSGGTALKIAENGGFVSVDDGAEVSFAPNTISGLILSNASATVHSGTTANSTAINHGVLEVLIGGSANDTIVNSFGTASVSSGGIANKTTVNLVGYMTVSSGGIANNTTVNSRGSMHVLSGGIANNTTVNSLGRMHVLSGGTALEIRENGGYVEIADGANVTFTPNTIKGEIAVATIHSGTSADNPTLNVGGKLYIYSGGFATEIKENGGFVSVEEGANVTFAHNTINGITLSGSATIHSGTVTNGITISCYYMSVYSGGIINDADVNFAEWPGGTCEIVLYSGAVANDTDVFGSTAQTRGRIVLSGGTANHTVLNGFPTGGAQMIVIGGIANKTTVNSGTVSVSSGGIANKTTVNLVGYMTVSSGGIANNTTVNSRGRMDVSSGGIANNTTVNSSGSVWVSNGGRLTGRMAFDASAVVSAERGGVVDFDISELVPKNTVRVNALSNIKGTPIYTLTVSGSQTDGTYNLAEGAAGFDQSITVMNTSGKELGSLTLGQTTKIRNISYLLELNEDKLTVSVEETHDTTAPTVINIKANTTAPAKQIVVMAEFDDDVEVASVLYRIGTGEEWQDYLNGVTVTENTSVYFKAIDISGNESEIAQYEITNIDTIPPEKPKVSADITAQTEGNVAVTAVFSEDSTKKEYSLDGENWKSYTKPITFTKNGTGYFRAADAAGNVSEIVSYTVDNIGKILPGTLNVSVDITKPTNGIVTVSAVYSDESVRLEYSCNGTSWESYTSPIVFSENGTAYFRGVDNEGNMSAVTSYVVANIDKQAPEKPDVSADTTTPTKRRVLVSTVFSEDSAKKEYSLDGEEWTAYTEAVKVTENSTVFFRGIDEAGNVSEVASYEVTNIDKSLPDNGPDDGWNDSLYDKKTGMNPKADEFISATLTEGFSGNVQFDEAGSVNEDGRYNFVGVLEDDFIDVADYAKLKLETAARLVFTIDSTDAVKFIICKVSETTGKNGKISYSVKTLQTTPVSLKKNAESVEVDTKKLLLEAGEYYLSVQSTNYKKGGAAFYNVVLNSDESEFFTKGDNGENNWLYDKKAAGNIDGWNPYVTGADAILVDETFRGKAIQLDDVPIEGHGELTNFVGFGDTMDVRKIELTSAANINFDVTLNGGAGKFFLYTVDEKGKLKTVANVALKASGSLKKPVLVDAGTYYLGVQSTNAKKGEAVYYNVAVSNNSTFFVDGDTGLNNYDSKAKAVTAEVKANPVDLTKGELVIDGILDGTNIDHNGYHNFVGFGDASDIVKINAVVGQTLSLKVTATDAVSLTLYGLKNGKVTSIKSVKSKHNVAEINDFTFTEKNGTEFYVGVEATNAKKGEKAWYNVEVVSFSGAAADALYMPETDSLAIADSLSFGNYGADALVDASVSALAKLDDKSGWQSLLA